MMKKNIKTAVILCGGRGSRLGSIGKKIPKSLIKINGKPIIWYIIKTLKKNSFNHFILPIGYKGNMIKKFIRSKHDLNKLNIEIINTGINNNIANRIYQIKKKIISNNFLLLNGDAIFNFNIKKIFELHSQKKIDQTFIGCENSLPYGTIGMVNNKIVSFDRNLTFNSVKIRKKKNFLGYVYSGMTIINKSILKLNFKNYQNFEQKLYPKIIKKFNTKFVIFKGFWHSIDNNKDIEATKNYSILKNILKLKKNLAK